MSFLLIKTILKMTKIGKFLRNVGLVTKRVALGGKDVLLPNFNANRDAPEGGKGKLDYVRLAGTILLIVLIIGFFFGKVTMEQVQTILEFLKQ